MAEQHTPGPWHVGCGDWREGSRAIYDENHVAVALAWVSPQGPPPTLEQAKANARLIAAAPDLLQELKHLVRLLEPVEDTLNVPGLATLNGARAAVAKAQP